MAVNSSLERLVDKEFGYKQARHLLNRAGFGGPRWQVEALVRMGLEKSVDLLVDYQDAPEPDVGDAGIDADYIRPPTREELIQIRDARRNQDQAAIARYQGEQQRRQRMDRGQLTEMRRWWLARMISTARPLEEKLTLFWHGHFASNYRSVRDSYLLFRQNELFREHANGNFATLAGRIVRDPAMLKFLNNDRNNKARPNENLARELMELFTLGEGNYTERDIKQGARALTGYTVRDNDFAFARRNHDMDDKTIFGKTGDYDGDDFVALCLQQPSCASYITGKLYAYFVSDLPNGMDENAKSVVEQLAGQFVSENHELKPMLKTLFKSRHFYDDQIIGNMIKSPAQLVAGSVRILQTPVRDLNVLLDGMNLMGQQLFEPPTVAGWDGGRAWINTSTLFVRQNLATFLITGRLPNGAQVVEKPYDPLTVAEALEGATADEGAKVLIDALLACDVHAERTTELRSLLSQSSDKLTAESVRDGLLLTTTMPEYQLC